MSQDLKGIISTLEGVLTDLKTLDTPVVPPPPPPAPWPSNPANVFSIDFVAYTSVMDARFLDGNLGWDGTGRVIHYGDMSGPMPTNPPPGELADWAGKFSNFSYRPTFGYDPKANLRYLQNGTDGSKEAQPKQSGICGTCRVVFWQFKWMTPRPEYFFRVALWFAPETLANQTELGIKLLGFGNYAQNISQILELGRKTATGWPLQVYAYDAEGSQRVDPMPDAPEIVPGRWYVFEGHCISNTQVNGVWLANGKLEFKVNGSIVYSRHDLKTFNAARPGPFTTLYEQKYHGGTVNASGPLIFRTAALAVSSTDWLGPPKDAVLS